MKRAKIVATIGPASKKKQIFASMVRHGLDVARLNFSHGTREDHGSLIRMIRSVSFSLRRPVAILQDLQGIKIRLGEMESGPFRLTRGREILLMPGQGNSSESVLYVSYPRLTRDLRRGDRVLIDDGLIQLNVEGKERGRIRARVVEGGIVQENKGVNFPDSPIRLSSFTEKDRGDLDLGIKMGVDFVAVSFVRKPDDVVKVKRYMKDKGVRIPVIAKIERPEALTHIDGILNASDGIMVARGDLGVELDPEEVPVIQKELICKANEAGKVVITATQMLESMTGHLRPTRAEATDVANAVLDGTDALMLSGETSTGAYPVQTVKMMERIIHHTETNLEPRTFQCEDKSEKKDGPYAIADAAARAAEDIHAKAIVAFTHSGYTARLVSRFRPAVKILAFATSEEVQRQLSLLWGVTPLRMKPLTSTDRMIRVVEDYLKTKKYLKKGELMVILASLPPALGGRTNFMKIHTIG